MRGFLDDRSTGRRCRGLPLFLVTFAAAFLLGAPASAQVIDVLSLNTTTTTGTSTTDTNVAGVGGFAGTTYTSVTWQGDDTSVTGFKTTNGTQYNPVSTGTFTVRRDGADPTPSNTIGWYNGTISGSTVTASAGFAGNMNTLLGANNILRGTDNLFGNQGDGNGNNNNIERADFVFSQFTANAQRGFLVVERGATTQHDGFKIAAITAVDGSGNPTNYGNLVTVASGWGQHDLDATTPTSIIIRNAYQPTDTFTDNNPIHPSTSTSQNLGGVFIHATDLVAAGTTIFGYSLFATDVTGTGTQLVDVTNTAFFPTSTSSATDAAGGIDLAATGTVLYQAVPEPSSLVALGLISAGAGGWFGWKRRRGIKSDRVIG